MANENAKGAAKLIGPATVDAARELGKALPARSAEIEELRRLPDDVAAALVEMGAFRMFVPERFRGSQLTLADGLRVLEELSYWDSAAGWCAMIGALSGLQSAYLPPEHAQRIFGDDPRVVTGGTAEPRGGARLVEGGLRATGRWAWGSGTHHCSWIGGGCLLEEEGSEAPRFLFVHFERDQVTRHDNWHVGGLRGTGSCDFEVKDVFVPEGRWVERLVDAPRIDAPLYRFPQFGLLALGVGTVGLGVARRAIDELVAIAAEKRYVGSSRTLAQRQGVQGVVAEAQAALYAAHAFVDRAVEQAWTKANTGEIAVEDRRRLRLCATRAMRAAVEVVDSMYELAGGSAVYSRCPLDRLFRDIHVAASHGMVARRTYELAGRLALDLETDIRQL